MGEKHTTHYALFSEADDLRHCCMFEVASVTGLEEITHMATQHHSGRVTFISEETYQELKMHGIELWSDDFCSPVGAGYDEDSVFFLVINR